MDNDTVLWLAGGFGVLLVSVALLIVRSRRLSRWEEILAMPASSVSELRGRSKLQLPRGVDLDSYRPLFEVLYENYRERPGSFGATPIAEILEEFKPGDGGEPGLKTKVMTAAGPEDQQINDLVNVGGYHQANYMPLDVVASTLLKNLLAVMRGKKRLRDGVEHVMVDSLGAGGGLAGAKLGNILGASLVPLVPLAAANPLVLPATMIVGAWLGSYAGRTIGNRMKSRELYAAIKKMRLASKSFKRAFLERLPQLMEDLDRDYEERLEYTAGLIARRQNALTRSLYPAFMTTFYRRAALQLREDWDHDRHEWKLVHKKVRAMSPQEFAYVLYGVGAGSFRGDAELLEQFRAYEEALHELKLAQRAA